MSLEVTIAVLAVALVIAALANYKSRRPLELGKVQWIPYLGVQFAAILVVVLMIGHLITLLTGQPFTGRLSSI